MLDEKSMRYSWGTSGTTDNPCLIWQVFTRGYHLLFLVLPQHKLLLQLAKHLGIDQTPRLPSVLLDIVNHHFAIYRAEVEQAGCAKISTDKYVQITSRDLPLPSRPITSDIPSMLHRTCSMRECQAHGTQVRAVQPLRILDMCLISRQSHSIKDMYHNRAIMAIRPHNNTLILILIRVRSFISSLVTAIMGTKAGWLGLRTKT